jgi:hypothetical protein
MTDVNAESARALPAFSTPSFRSFYGIGYGDYQCRTQPELRTHFRRGSRVDERPRRVPLTVYGDGLEKG